MGAFSTIYIDPYIPNSGLKNDFFKIITWEMTQSERHWHLNRFKNGN